MNVLEKLECFYRSPSVGEKQSQVIFGHILPGEVGNRIYEGRNIIKTFREERKKNDNALKPFNTS